MTVIPKTYLQASADLDEIQKNTSIYYSQFLGALERMKSASAEINKMSQAAPTGYLDSIQYINAQTAANPNDKDWDKLKSHKDKLQSDFITLRNTIDSAITEVELILNT